MQVNGSLCHVYGFGEWFVPCHFTDVACKNRTSVEFLNGEVDPKLAGFHHYTGTWNG